jgi:endonuclease/exonuclease/phosphatase family protein
LRIVTWNCCRGPFDAKAGALARLKADIAILTETARPKADDTPQRLWFGGSKGSGIVVLAGGGFTLEREHAVAASDSDPVRAIRVGGPVSFHLMAVWGRQNSDYIRGVYDRVVEQLDFAKRRPTVLAGDLNSNTIWDRPRARMDHSRFVAWLRSELDLVSAYHEHRNEAHGKESKPTYYFLWNRARPYHIDYCFVPRAWGPRIRRVTIGGYEAWSRWSDHRPVMVEVDAHRATVPTGRMASPLNTSWILP